MEVLKASVPSGAALPTLGAEELAAEYLERDPVRPMESKLQHTPLAKVCRLPSADRTIVALFREERLKSELATLIAAVVRAAVETLKEKLESPRCHFQLRLGPDLPRIHGDDEALPTVLINLLDNACKYTNGKKRITARAYAEGRFVRFEVEDNGIGLLPPKRGRSSTVSIRSIRASRGNMAAAGSDSVS